MKPQTDLADRVEHRFVEEPNDLVLRPQHLGALRVLHLSSDRFPELRVGVESRKCAHIIVAPTTSAKPSFSEILCGFLLVVPPRRPWSDASVLMRSERKQGAQPSACRYVFPMAGVAAITSPKPSPHVPPHVTPTIPGHPTSPHVTPRHPTSPHVTPCHPTSPHITPQHPDGARCTKPAEPNCRLNPHNSPHLGAYIHNLRTSALCLVG